MRAYVGQIDRSGLRRFLPEDAVPADLLRQLVREWSSRATTVVWAVVADDDAEALRRELRAGDPADACILLLDRAVEILPLASSAPELAQPAPHADNPGDESAPPHPAGIVAVADPSLPMPSPPPPHPDSPGWPGGSGGACPWPRG